MLLCACVGALPRHDTPGTPVAHFPAKSELEALPPPAARGTESLNTIEVQRWQLRADEEPGLVYPSASPWDRIAIERFPGESAPIAIPVRLSPELRCAAQEVARFFVESAAFPEDALRDYIALRCGSTLPKLTVATLTGSARDALPAPAFADRFDSEVREFVKRLPVPSGADFGFGNARGHGRTAFVAFWGSPLARLKGFAPLFQGVGVTLEGDCLGDSMHFLGLANQGKLGVAVCETDRSQALPHFRIFCPIARDDDASVIQVAVRRPGRVLLDVIAQALVRRTDTAGLLYEPPLFAADTPNPTAAAFGDALYGALNQARRAVGAAALRPEAEQARWNTRLAPDFFQASASGDDRLTDRLALGVLAGWDVKGVIRNGGLSARSAQGERNAARWLARELWAPLSRYILLDPSMTSVAIGATDLGPDGAGALITTYALFRDDERASDEAVLEDELTRARAALGKPRPKFLAPGRALQTALARISGQGVSAFAAMSDALADNARDSRPGTSGWAFEGNDLDAPRWPLELMAPANLEVELGVTHYKPAGAAWGQYAALFVIRTGWLREAAAEAPRRRE